jgi:V-type H+-transporting ATPase subunit e
MGAAILPLVLFTAIFGVIAGVLPIFIPKNPNKGVFQVVLLLIGVCCWLFWICCYMSQMNPLIGPKLNQRTLLAIKEYWGFDPNFGN